MAHKYRTGNTDWLGNLPTLAKDAGREVATSDTYYDCQYFSAAEFGDWAMYMDSLLIGKLDIFRGLLGSPVHIRTPHDGGLGERVSPDSGRNVTSKHNVEHWGMVMAADVQIGRDVSLKRAFDCAVLAKFTGIGLYPQWLPGHGLHLDVRLGRTINPAKWGWVDDRMVNVYNAIDLDNQMRESL